MQPIKNILVVIDPTADIQPAAEKACKLGAKCGATVELFVADYDQYLSGERFFDSKALARARKHLIETDIAKLNKLAKALSVHGAKITVDARWGTPLDETIIDKATTANVDLVVKDTHYHNVMKRSIFSNTDWNLIRGCPAPLMLVKPTATSASPRIIAAVDPVHENDKPAILDREILAQADRLTSLLEGRLHIFHAYDPASAFAMSADSMAFPITVPVREITESIKLNHQNAMQEMLADWSGTNTHETHILEGDVRESLLRLIDKVDAGIVVLGAVSRSGLKRLFLGSTAEQLLDSLPCDLLIVKADTSQTS